MSAKPTPVARILMAVCCAGLLGFCLPLIAVGAGDVRMSGVFSLDESLAAEDVIRLYTAGFSEPPPFRYYGGLFYYIPLVILKLISLVWPVTEQVVIITLRAICSVAGLGCMWMTYRVGGLAFDRTTGAAGAFLLVASPTFLRWTVEAHPDLPQLFWILCAVFCCCRLCHGLSIRQVVLASVFSGLAFATKLSGGFLLPILAAAVLLPHARMLNAKAAVARLKEGRYLLALVVIPGVFLLTFSLTHPFAVLRFQAFVDSVVSLKKTLAFGQTFREAGSGWQWLGAVTSTVGSVNTAFCLAAVLLFLRNGILHRKPRADVGLIVLWIGLFLGYLVLEVNLRRSRYLLPILPFALLLSASCYRSAIEWLFGRRMGVRHSLVGLPLVILAASLGQWEASAALFEDKLTRVDRNPDLALGPWLVQEFPDSTTILYDAYAYIPSRFRNSARVALGLSYPIVNFLEPDVVVLRQGAARDYADLDQAHHARIGPQAFRDSHYFYRYMKEGRLPAYRLARDFGSAAVYRRVHPKVGHTAYPVRTWNDRVRSLVARQLYGAGPAREVMGDVHSRLGLWQEADREYQLAREIDSLYTPVLYKSAVTSLQLGRLDEARTAFGVIHERVGQQKPESRAEIHTDVAKWYFNAGVVDDAIGELRAALVLVPELRDARFSLAACALAKGDSTGADSLYADAVRRYGPDLQAARWLEGLRQLEATSGAAESLYRRYFAQARTE